ncbi:hypothetical protein [Escherichia coli IS35]|nr:hypothetical protein [Escherichia coli IS35]
MKIEIACNVRIRKTIEASLLTMDMGYAFPGKKEWGSPEADNHVPLQDAAAWWQ